MKFGRSKLIGDIFDLCILDLALALKRHTHLINIAKLDERNWS